MLSAVNLLRAFGSFVARVLAFIGRHPTPILVLPSLWFLLRYLPFWKDIDATVQLIAPAYDDNLLHFPPVYSFLARVPFFIIDSLLNGHAPGIFERQHPSLVAVYGLVVIQHASLWLALRYFAFSWPAREIARGAITLLLASVASFYAFAHTGGSEAMTPIAYFLVFGAGIRALLGRATWSSWVIYTAALFLAVGSLFAPVVAARADDVVPAPSEIPSPLSLDEALRIFRMKGLSLLIADTGVRSAEDQVADALGLLEAAY